MDSLLIFGAVLGVAWGLERYLEREFTDIKSRLYDIEEKLNKH
jgi:hypothetical protein